MRFTFSPNSLLALATAVLAAAQPPTKLLNPDSSVIHPVARVGTLRAALEPRTNAKRFAAGLPPLPPRAHGRHIHREGHRAGTRVNTARRSVASPLPPGTVKCNILVKNVENITTLGYVSPVWNSYGQYGIFQTDQAGALEVSFSDPPYWFALLDFSATNGPNASYPLIGATLGVGSLANNLTLGSPEHAYITGTTKFGIGLPQIGDNNSFNAATGASQGAESAIWGYDSVTQAITARWVKLGSELVNVQLAYVVDAINNTYVQNTLILTGDVAATQDYFGKPVSKVTFTCVPPL